MVSGNLLDLDNALVESIDFISSLIIIYVFCKKVLRYGHSMPKGS